MIELNQTKSVLPLRWELIKMRENGRFFKIRVGDGKRKQNAEIRKILETW